MLAANKVIETFAVRVASNCSEMIIFASLRIGLAKSSAKVSMLGGVPESGASRCLFRVQASVLVALERDDSDPKRLCGF